MTAIRPPPLLEDDFEPELEDELESELSEPHAASASTARLRAATSRPRMGLNIRYSSVERLRLHCWFGLGRRGGRERGAAPLDALLALVENHRQDDHRALDQHLP